MCCPVVVSVSPRDPETHRRTLAAIRAAGFSQIYVTCEPGVELQGDLVLEVHHPEKRGQWRNFVEALRIGIATEAPYFICHEDDVELCRGTADLIARLGWPAQDCGCLQLYSALPLGSYPEGRRFQLADVNALDLLGACAMMLRRDAAQVLVEWADTLGWRGDTSGVVTEPSQKKAADTFVGEVLRFKGFTIWAHNPTLANHIGDTSTLGHNSKSANPLLTENPNRKPLNFPGVDADLNAIFAEEFNAPCSAL